MATRHVRRHHQLWLLLALSSALAAQAAPNARGHPPATPPRSLQDEEEPGVETDSVLSSGGLSRWSVLSPLQMIDMATSAGSPEPTSAASPPARPASIDVSPSDGFPSPPGEIGLGYSPPALPAGGVPDESAAWGSDGDVASDHSAASPKASSSLGPQASPLPSPPSVEPPSHSLVPSGMSAALLGAIMGASNAGPSVGCPPPPMPMCNGSQPSAASQCSAWRLGCTSCLCLQGKAICAPQCAQANDANAQPCCILREATAHPAAAVGGAAASDAANTAPLPVAASAASPGSRSRAAALEVFSPPRPPQGAAPVATGLAGATPRAAPPPAPHLNWASPGAQTPATAVAPSPQARQPAWQQLVVSGAGSRPPAAAPPTPQGAGSLVTYQRTGGAASSPAPLPRYSSTVAPAPRPGPRPVNPVTVVSEQVRGSNGPIAAAVGAPYFGPPPRCPVGCRTYFDGCNTCVCTPDGAGFVSCSRRPCRRVMKTPECLIKGREAACLPGCYLSFDGCSVCACSPAGKQMQCRHFACRTQTDTKCILKFTDPVTEPDELDPPMKEPLRSHLEPLRVYPTSCTLYFDGCVLCGGRDGFATSCERSTTPCPASGGTAAPMEAACLSEEEAFADVTRLLSAYPAMIRMPTVEETAAEFRCPEGCAIVSDGCRRCGCRGGYIDRCQRVCPMGAQPGGPLRCVSPANSRGVYLRSHSINVTAP
eukprot:GHVT01009713.1.p1 GENE.GHVT01009713.1~~GHVT01009713.1.p1  ORF type:complete len:710 (+),score=168.31 GHVT01009713.1:573-2702(+)